MTPLAIRARIESLLRSSSATDPQAAALLSRMPRPRCGTPGCAGKLSRNTGRCARCGGVKVVDRYTRADGTRFDRERERPSVPISDDDALYAQEIIAHGTSVFQQTQEPKRK